jgi:hypothetical protein
MPIPPPPQADSQADPNVPLGAKNRALGIAGGLLGGLAGTGGQESKLDQAIAAHHQRQIDEAKMHRQNAATFFTLLHIGKNPETGEPLTPEEQQRYQNQYNAAMDAYQKLTGVNKQTKAAVQQSRQILDRQLATKTGQPPQGAQGTAPAGGGQSAPQKMGSVGPPPAASPPQQNPNPLEGQFEAQDLRQKMGKAQERSDEEFKSNLKIKEEAAKAEAEAKSKFTKGENYVGPDGKVFLGTPTPSGQVANATTGEIVPNATKAGVTSAAKPPAPPLGKPRVDQLNQATAARWQAGNPGKPMPTAFILHDDATQKDYDNLSKLVNESAVAAVRSKEQGASADLSPDAIDALAGVFVRTGQMPAMGLGGMPVRTKIFNRAGQILAGKGPTDPGLGDKLAASSAAYKSLSSAQTQLQRQRSAVGAFESTSLKNLQIFENAAKKVVDEGSPWINQPLREVEQGALGSDDVVAYNTARNVALTEISRVLSNPNLTGVLSDEARNQVGALIGPGATLSNVLTASNILRQDMENRKSSIDEEIKAVTDQIKQAPAKGAGATPRLDQNPPPRTGSEPRRIVIQ